MSVVPEDEKRIVVTQTSAKLFAHIIETLNKCGVEQCECVIRKDDGGLCIMHLSADHVFMVHLQLPSRFFKAYDVSETATLDLSIKELKQVLALSKNDDQLCLTHAIGSDETKWTFGAASVEGEEAGTFTIRQVTNIKRPENLCLPDVVYDAHIKMHSRDFATICNNLFNIGGVMKISVSKTHVRFFVAGDLTSGSLNARGLSHATFHGLEEVEAGVAQEDVVVESRGKKAKKSTNAHCGAYIVYTPKDDTKSEVSLTYSLKFLCMFASASSISKYVTLKLERDAPLCLDFTMGDADDDADRPFLRFYLAPKVDVDEKPSSIGKKRKREDGDDD